MVHEEAAQILLLIGGALAMKSANASFGLADASALGAMLLANISLAGLHKHEDSGWLCVAFNPWKDFWDALRMWDVQKNCQAKVRSKQRWQFLKLFDSLRRIATCDEAD